LDCLQEENQGKLNLLKFTKVSLVCCADISTGLESTPKVFKSLLTLVFNIGSYRRKELGSGQKHNFFDPQNKEGYESRTKMAILALEE
jgi:hypothetical protein